MTVEHLQGDMETMRFEHRRKPYYEYLNALRGMDVPLDDLLHHFPTFVGHMTLSRFLTIYEFYKMARGIAGHIADVGVYKGASSFMFAKLIAVHEPEAMTLCHGFDWFQGSAPGEKDSERVPAGGYKGDYDTLMRLIELQQLGGILKIHKLDLRNELPTFFENHPHLRFKLVMMDAGFYEVMTESIRHFYDKLVPGGIMIFDQYSHELSPGETLAVEEQLPGVTVHTIPNSWMPNAYVIKDQT